MAQVKERGGGGEEGKETQTNEMRKQKQTNPGILKTTHLACDA